MSYEPTGENQPPSPYNNYGQSPVPPPPSGEESGTNGNQGSYSEPANSTYGSMQQAQPQPPAAAWGANTDQYAPVQPYNAGGQSQPVAAPAYAQSYPQQAGGYPQQAGQHPPQTSGYTMDADSVGSWMLAIFLTAIPLVGFIYVLTVAFGNTASRARQNWARAMFYLMLIMIGIIILFSMITGSFIGGLLRGSTS